MDINEKLDLILQTMNEKFEQVDKRFEQVDKRFEQVDKRFEQVDKRFEQMDNKLERMDKDIAETQRDIKAIKKDITEINLRIENEICKNIQIVAEGHLDLSRNLQAAMTPYNEVEMLRIRLSYLERKLNNLEKTVEMKKEKVVTQ